MPARRFRRPIVVLNPVYSHNVEVVFPDSIFHQIKYHVNSSIYYMFAIPFVIMFAAEFYFATGVGGCGWPISCREVHIEVVF